MNASRSQSRFLEADQALQGPGHRSRYSRGCVKERERAEEETVRSQAASGPGVLAKVPVIDARTLRISSASNNIASASRRGRSRGSKDQRGRDGPARETNPFGLTSIGLVAGRFRKGAVGDVARKVQ